MEADTYRPKRPAAEGYHHVERKLVDVLEAQVHQGSEALWRRWFLTFSQARERVPGS